MGASSSKLPEIYVNTSANWWVYDAQKSGTLKKKRRVLTCMAVEQSQLLLLFETFHKRSSAGLSF